MKYVLSKKIEVLVFKAYSNELSYADKSENLIFRNQIIANKHHGTGNFLLNRYFFYKNEHRNITFIDVETNKTTEILGYVTIPSERCFDGEIFVTHEYLDLVDFKQQLISYNIKTNEKKVIKPDIGAILLHNKKVITKGSAKIIRSLSLLTGEYEWEVDLGDRRYLDDSRQEKIASITQVLGIWENQLLVVMDSGELISIDIQTGQLLWHKADIYTHTLSSFPNRSQFWRSYWHLENGYLYQLDGNVYYRVSLTTQTLEILWQDTKQDAYLTFSHKTFTEEYVYFTGSYHRDLSPYLLGVFNRKTLQIDWLYDFGNQLVHEKGDYPHSLNQPPQVAENKLYVLDSGGTLHIFEREA